MPKVAEIKEMDGELWVRIDRPTTNEGAIHIWTEYEAKRYKEQAISAFAECVMDFMREYRR